MPMQCVKPIWEDVRRNEPHYPHLFTGAFYTPGQVSLFTSAEHSAFERKGLAVKKARQKSSVFILVNWSRGLMRVPRIFCWNLPLLRGKIAWLQRHLKLI